MDQVPTKADDSSRLAGVTPTAAFLSLADDEDTTALRATLELGATSEVSFATLSLGMPLPLAAGGTAATTAAAARTALGLAIDTNVQAYNANANKFVRDILLGTLSPADATTYYIGQGSGWSTTPALRRMYIPSACTITKFYGWFGQTAGTAETSSIYVRVNNTTDTLISSSVINNVSGATTFSNASMSLVLAAGDYIEIKWVTPTWVTNPSGTFGSFVMEFQL